MINATSKHGFTANQTEIPPTDTINQAPTNQALTAPPDKETITTVFSSMTSNAQPEQLPYFELDCFNQWLIGPSSFGPNPQQLELRLARITEINQKLKVLDSRITVLNDWLLGALIFAIVHAFVIPMLASYIESSRYSRFP
jgi:hypothetical protein